MSGSHIGRLRFGVYSRLLGSLSGPSIVAAFTAQDEAEAYAQLCKSSDTYKQFLYSVEEITEANYYARKRAEAEEMFARRRGPGKYLGWEYRYAPPPVALPDCNWQARPPEDLQLPETFGIFAGTWKELISEISDFMARVRTHEMQKEFASQ
jgi:hypothetical protein